MLTSKSLNDDIPDKAIQRQPFAVDQLLLPTNEVHPDSPMAELDHHVQAASLSETEALEESQVDDTQLANSQESQQQEPQQQSRKKRNQYKYAKLSMLASKQLTKIMASVSGRTF